MIKGQALPDPRASAVSRRAYGRRLQATIRSDSGAMPKVCCRRQPGKYLRPGAFRILTPSRHGAAAAAAP